MYYPEEIIEEVRERNDIVDVISSYIKLQRRGSSYFGLCPFHNEKTGSFSVSPSKQMYYCFGCGAGGNVISFRMQYENETFPEAVKALAQRAGIALPEEAESEDQKKARNVRARLMEMNKLAGTFYYYQLRSPEGKTGLAYLQGRNLSEETMRSFGLGFAGKKRDSLCRFLKQKGFDNDLLRRSGLTGYDEKSGMYDKFFNRVMFPIMDVNSRIIGFGGRVMGDGKPKYLNSPETEVFDKGRNLYGLNIARRTREPYLILCEGYMDVISMHQAGFTNAVASLGTALTQGHASLLRRYTKEVILSYDSDEAGTKAALRAIPILREAGIRARVLDLKPYKDPDELIKALGAETFRERLNSARSSFDFEMEVTEKKYRISDPEEKTRFLTEAAAYIARFDMEVERETYTQAVAARYHVSYEGMKKMVLRQLMRGDIPERTVRHPDAPGERKNDGVSKTEGLVLTLMSEYPGFYRAAKPYLKPEDFSDDVTRKSAQTLFEQLEKGKALPAAVPDQFSEEEERKRASALFQVKLPEMSGEELRRAMREALRSVIQASMERQEKETETDGAASDDLGALKAVLERKRVLEEIGRLPIDIST